MFSFGFYTFYHRNNWFQTFLQVRKEHIDTYTPNIVRKIDILNQIQSKLSIFFTFKSNHSDYLEISSESSSHTIRLKL